MNLPGFGPNIESSEESENEDNYNNKINLCDFDYILSILDGILDKRNKKFSIHIFESNKMDGQIIMKNIKGCLRVTGWKGFNIETSNKLIKFTNKENLNDIRIIEILNL